VLATLDHMKSMDTAAFGRVDRQDEQKVQEHRTFATYEVGVGKAAVAVAGPWRGTRARLLGVASRAAPVPNVFSCRPQRLKLIRDCVTQLHKQTQRHDLQRTQLLAGYPCGLPNPTQRATG
jgi:hypothetical protein